MQPDWQIKAGTQVVLVGGMHRSGTSMITRLLNLMGVELGEYLVPPLPDNNETGFWEHEHLVELHEALLMHYSTHHLGVVDLPDEYMRLKPVQDYQQKIFGIVRRDFAYSTCWGVKDPRISRLADLWNDTICQLGATPHWVISVRHPAEVAMSLRKRNKLDYSKGLLLWLKYNLEVERATRDMPRAIVYYPDVLMDWRKSLERISRLAEINWPRAYEDAADDVAAFIQPQLKHQQGADEPLSELVRETFRVLHQASQRDGGRADIAALDALWEEFQRINAPMQEEMAQMRRAIAAQSGDIEVLQTQLGLLYGSTSWKLTRPVRSAKKLVKGLKAGVG